MQKPIDRAANERRTRVRVKEKGRKGEREGEGECTEIRYLPVGDIATRINLDDQFLDGRILVIPAFSKITREICEIGSVNFRLSLTSFRVSSRLNKFSSFTCSIVSSPFSLTFRISFYRNFLILLADS